MTQAAFSRQPVLSWFIRATSSSGQRPGLPLHVQLLSAAHAQDAGRTRQGQAGGGVHLCSGRGGVSSTVSKAAA